MKSLIKNLSGLYLTLIKDNSNYKISEEKIHNILNSFPKWMNDQIENDFASFSNKPNDIDGTINNFEKNGLLKSSQLVKIKIENNQLKFQSFLPIKFNQRFVRFSNYFKTILKFFKFSDVEFLYSFHDYFDDPKWLDLIRCPVFCISKLKGNNNVVLFPHIEWSQKNDQILDSICKAALHFDWDNKIDKAFWRGSITGYEDLTKNERYKIVRFSTKYPDFFDVRLTNINLSKNNKNELKNYFDPKIFSPYEQLKYKYLLAIDGNAFPGSFFWQLFSNSVVLKNKSNYLEWYYSNLNNNEHYIEYFDENDLLQKLLFLHENQDHAKIISKNANYFANECLSNESIAVYIFKLLEKYSVFAVNK